MMTDALSGKVALITGASSGIGRATAIACARAGAKVVAASRRITEGEETVYSIREAGGEAIFIQTDVSKADEVEALVRKTLDIYGRLDCACNNAGSVTTGSLIDTSEEEWNKMFDVNLKGTWFCLKHEVKAMLRQGRGAIVNIASVSGVVGFAGYTVYAATKGGIIALTRAAAIEYAKFGIRINVVSPGAIETDMLATLPTEMLAKISEVHPIGRVGRPKEVAEVVVCLFSDTFSFVMGHNLIVDGGYTIQ